MRTADNGHPTRMKRERSRGQVLVIFAGAIFLLMMLMAVVIDVSWYWVNSLRAQRAADAAALAGAVMLPNEASTAYGLATREATKNGFTQGVNGVTEVFPQQDAGNSRRLNVRIRAEIGTFFMRVLGLTEIPIVRRATAEFTLPVPMGSPENYYGVGVLNIPSEIVISQTTGWKDRGNEVGNWNDADEADNDVDASGPSSEWARSPVNGSGVSANDPQQQWTEFGLDQNPNAIPDDDDLQILGIEFRSRAFLQGSGGSTSGCRMDVQLSWNNGTSWTAIKSSGTLPTSGPPTSPPGPTIPYNVNLGGTADTWGRTWSYGDITDTGGSSFRVRVTFENSSNCSNTRRLAIDTLEVRVSFRWTDIGPPTPTPVDGPYGGTLAPQKFWGAMQSQGAPSIQGDAHMAGYTTRKSSANAEYHPVQGYNGSSQEYYNYGIELPGGSGEVWIFDPGFCDTGQAGSPPINQGTGENWTVGGSLGADPARPVSAQYVLYDDQNTPYEYGDDVPVSGGDSGTTFRRLMLSDPNLGGGSGGSYPGVSSCSSASWHNDWYRLASGLPGGKYRLHTTSRIYNPVSKAIDGSDNQTDSTGLNAFAIWVDSAGANPRVYGLGAMEAYFPLPGNQTSLFYLAQLEAVHADKWVDIDLWDPGDTGSLSAVLSIKRPDGTVNGTTQPFYWNAFTGTNLPASFQCGPTTSSQVNGITTSTGSGGIFNGRWLRICFRIPATYTAPNDPTFNEPGWWKISYAMSGSGASTDLTTWKIAVRGNPVHLVIP